jgi:hypothetical protein
MCALPTTTPLAPETNRSLENLPTWSGNSGMAIATPNTKIFGDFSLSLVLSSEIVEEATNVLNQVDERSIDLVNRLRPLVMFT